MHVLSNSLGWSFSQSALRLTFNCIFTFYVYVMFYYILIILLIFSINRLFYYLNVMLLLPSVIYYLISFCPIMLSHFCDAGIYSIRHISLCIFVRLFLILIILFHFNKITSSLATIVTRMVILNHFFICRFERILVW